MTVEFGQQSDALCVVRDLLYVPGVGQEWTAALHVQEVDAKWLWGD